PSPEIPFSDDDTTKSISRPPPAGWVPLDPHGSRRRPRRLAVASAITVLALVAVTAYAATLNNNERHGATHVAAANSATALNATTSLPQTTTTVAVLGPGTVTDPGAAGGSPPDGGGGPSN